MQSSVITDEQSCRGQNKRKKKKERKKKKKGRKKKKKERTKKREKKRKKKRKGLSHRFNLPVTMTTLTPAEWHSLIA